MQKRLKSPCRRMTLEVVSFHSSQSRNELTRIRGGACYLHREWLSGNSLYTCPEPLHFASSVTVQCNFSFRLSVYTDIFTYQLNKK
jgi:hypothetical protein